MRSHHHRSNHHYQQQQSSATIRSTSTEESSSSSAGVGDVRMTSSVLASSSSASSRVRSNADMVHASYARLVEKVQKMEEENCQLMKIAENHKLEYNRIVTQVMESEVEQSRLEQECSDLRKRVDELTEINIKLKQAKRRSMSTTTQTATATPPPSPVLLTTAATTDAAGRNFKLKQLAQQTGMPDNLIDQLLTRLAPFLSLLLASDHFDLPAPAATTRTSSSSKLVQHQHSSEEDSAIDTNDTASSTPIRQSESSASLNNFSPSSTHLTGRSPSVSSIREQLPAQPRMGLQAAKRQCSVASNSATLQSSTEPQQQTAMTSASSCDVNGWHHHHHHRQTGIASSGSDSSSFNSWSSSSMVANTGHHRHQHQQQRNATTAAPVAQPPQKSCSWTGEPDGGRHRDDSRRDGFVDGQDVEEDREAMTSLQPALRCQPYLGQERHGFCGGGEDRPREVAVATADRWEEYRDEEEEDDYEYYNNNNDDEEDDNQATATTASYQSEAAYASADDHHKQSSKRRSYVAACRKAQSMDHIAPAPNSTTTSSSSSSAAHHRHHLDDNDRDVVATQQRPRRCDGDTFVFPCPGIYEDRYHVTSATAANNCHDPDTGIVGPCGPEHGFSDLNRSNNADEDEEEAQVPRSIGAKKHPEKGILRNTSPYQHHHQQQERLVPPTGKPQTAAQRHQAAYERQISSSNFNILPINPAGAMTSYQSSQEGSKQRKVGEGKKGDRSLVGLMKSKFTKSSSKSSTSSANKSQKVKDASGEFTSLHPPVPITIPTGISGSQSASCKSFASVNTRQLGGHSKMSQSYSGPQLSAVAAASHLAPPKLEAEALSDEGFAESSTIERMERTGPSDSLYQQQLTRQQQQANNKRKVELNSTTSSSTSSFTSVADGAPAAASTNHEQDHYQDEDLHHQQHYFSTSKSREMVKKSCYKLQPLQQQEEKQHTGLPTPSNTSSNNNTKINGKQQQKPHQQKSLAIPKIKSKVLSKQASQQQKTLTASGQQIAAEDKAKQQHRSPGYYNRPPLPTYQEASRIKQKMVRTVSSPTASEQQQQQRLPYSNYSRRPSTSAQQQQQPSSLAPPPRRLSYSSQSGQRAPDQQKNHQQQQLQPPKSKLRSLYSAEQKCGGSPPQQQQQQSDQVPGPHNKSRLKKASSSSALKPKPVAGSNHNSPSRLARLIRPTR